MAPSFDPVKVNSITYTLTAVIFTVFYFIKLRKLPFPVQGCLLEADDIPYSMYPQIKLLILVLWDLHFMRRLIEVLFVHTYNRKMPIFECIGAPMYYWPLAFLIAWSVNGDAYKMTYMPLLIIGTVVFLIGEFGNAWCHWQLRMFRERKHLVTMVSPETGHVVPYGGVFRFVSCPHYFFEIITWLGFFLVTWTLLAVLLLLFTIITLAIYSKKKHNAYHKEFDGEEGRPAYPKSRAALVPFIF